MTVHGFSSEGSCEQIDLLVFPLLESFWFLEQFDLDADILLRTQTFSALAIVVSAWLIVKLGENRVAFGVGNLVLRLQVAVLPAHEAIEVRVLFGREERTAPVNSEAESFQIILTLGRESLAPVEGVLEGGDVCVRNAQLLQNLVLGECGLRHLGILLQFFGCWLVGANLAICDFTLQAVGSSLDGHARAMETEGEKHTFSQLLLVANLKLGLGNRVCVTQMQLTVHVREGECCHVLFLVLLFEGHRAIVSRCIGLPDILSFELVLHLVLNLAKTLKSRLVFCWFNHLIVSVFNYCLF